MSDLFTWNSVLRVLIYGVTFVKKKKQKENVYIELCSVCFGAFCKLCNKTTLYNIDVCKKKNL